MNVDPVLLDRLRANCQWAARDIDLDHHARCVAFTVTRARIDYEAGVRQNPSPGADAGKEDTIP